MSVDKSLDAKRNRAAELESGNQRSYEELQEVTKKRYSMDTSDMRRELFIECLVKWGVVSEEQKLDFDIAFHERVEEALNGAWAKFREANNPKLQVVRSDKRLTDKHGRPIGG